MITRSNYEIVFIDYFDGKLDKVGQERLFAFLRANPDLEEEFNRYAGIQAEPDYNISFADKDRLKKDTITTFNYKTWLVAYIENDLNSAQKKEVDFFLSKNPSFKTELEILKQTKLVPDQQVIFHKKNSLRKGAKVIYFNTAVKRTISIAAALLLIAISYYLIRQQNAPQSMIATSEEKNGKEIKSSQKSEIVQANPVIEEKKEESKIITHKKSVNKSPEKEIDRSNYFAVHFSNPEETPEENACDDYHPPVQPTVSHSEIAENKSGNINYRSGANTNFQGMTFEQIKLSQNNLSEIFSKDDLNDLEKIHKKNVEKIQSNSSSLLDLAAQEIQKISKATEIIVEKKNDPSDNSVTYAFEVGKNFSITHTTEK
jgi:hypothetical protein